MDSEDLRKRTKDFSLRIIALVAALPRSRESAILGRQILKSGTSIGANYREALRASSKRQFTSIVEFSLREAEETLYWLELLAESKIVKPTRLKHLLDECDQLVAILVSTVRTAKRK